MVAPFPSFRELPAPMAIAKWIRYGRCKVVGTEHANLLGGDETWLSSQVPPGLFKNLRCFCKQTGRGANFVWLDSVLFAEMTICRGRKLPAWRISFVAQTYHANTVRNHANIVFDNCGFPLMTLNQLKDHATLRIGKSVRWAPSSALMREFSSATPIAQRTLERALSNAFRFQQKSQIQKNRMTHGWNAESQLKIQLIT